jgi:hypothetical protein
VFRQPMADGACSEVEFHLAQDGRAELKEILLAASSAENSEDGRRKEFASDLVPRETGLFRNPHRNALTQGVNCGHRTGRAASHNLDRPHERPS